MNINTRIFLLFLFFFSSSMTYGEAGDEQALWLDDMAVPENWTPCEATVSKGEMVDGRPSVIFHIDVDYSSGQKGYPIGWPRMYFTKATNIPWKDYDYLEFRVSNRFSRDTLPVAALSFSCYGASSKREIALGRGNIPKQNEFVMISIPLSRFEKIDPIKVIGFSISEREYKDKDSVSFTMGAFRLRRSVVCSIDKMSCLGVRRNKTGMTLPVQLSIKDGGGVGVPFEISCNKKVLRLETLPVARGESTLLMDITELKLASGNYVLTAYPHKPKLRKSVDFTVNASQLEEK